MATTNGRPMIEIKNVSKSYHRERIEIPVLRDLTIDVPDNLPPLYGDKDLLGVALTNLLTNAIKYTPENGKVILRVKACPDGLQFEVQDTGIGISPEDQPRLFEKFFRGSQREARLQRGSGLGLAIVRSISERHGGKVWVESGLGQGSTFFLLIPFVRPNGMKKKEMGE